MRIIFVVAAIPLLVGCMLPLTGVDDSSVSGAVSERQMRQVSTVLDPYCTADGAVVLFQISNSRGTYDGAEASRENCPWFK